MIGVLENARPFVALIRRELTATLRRDRSFILLLLFVGTMFIMVVLAWPSEWPSKYINVGMAAYISSRIVLTIMTILLIASFLVTPGLAATTIVGEKEDGTYDQLHMTLISPRGIILGKLVNVLGFFVIMILGIMPVMGVVFFLVGVDWVQISLAMLWMLAFSISCGMAGIFCSAYYTKTGRDVGYSYEFVILSIVLPMLLWVLGIIAVTGDRRYAYELTSMVISPAAMYAPFQGRTTYTIYAVCSSIIFCIPSSRPGLRKRGRSRYHSTRASPCRTTCRGSTRSGPWSWISEPLRLAWRSRPGS